MVYRDYLGIDCHEVAKTLPNSPSLSVSATTPSELAISVLDTRRVMRSTVPLGVSPDRSTRARWTLPLLLLAVLGLVVPGLVAPATAYAADDPGIKVEVNKLVTTNSEGVVENDNQLTQ